MTPTCTTTRRCCSTSAPTPTPADDFEIVNGPLDILDHAAPRLGAGCKIGFDATPKWPGEEVHGHAVRDFPPLNDIPQPIKDLVDRRWSEYGL